MWAISLSKWSHPSCLSHAILILFYIGLYSHHLENSQSVHYHVHSIRPKISQHLDKDEGHHKCCFFYLFSVYILSLTVYSAFSDCSLSVYSCLVRFIPWTTFKLSWYNGWSIPRQSFSISNPFSAQLDASSCFPSISLSFAASKYLIFASIRENIKRLRENENFTHIVATSRPAIPSPLNRPMKSCIIRSSSFGS